MICRRATNFLEGFGDVGMSSWGEQSVLALFMRLSWSQTSNVATSRCWMSFHWWKCSPLQRMERVAKCSPKEEKHKLAVALSLNNQLFHLLVVLAPFAIFVSQFKAGSCGTIRRRCSPWSRFSSTVTLDVALWMEGVKSLSDGAFSCWIFEADGEWLNNNASNDIIHTISVKKYSSITITEKACYLSFSWSVTHAARILFQRFP